MLYKERFELFYYWLIYNGPMLCWMAAGFGIGGTLAEDPAHVGSVIPIATVLAVIGGVLYLFRQNMSSADFDRWSELKQREKDHHRRKFSSEAIEPTDPSKANGCGPSMLENALPPTFEELVLRTMIAVAGKDGALNLRELASIIALFKDVFGVLPSYYRMAELERCIGQTMFFFDDDMREVRERLPVGQRKLLYAAGFVSAACDGELTAEEAFILDNLATSLWLPSDTASEIQANSLPFILYVHSIPVN